MVRLAVSAVLFAGLAAPAVAGDRALIDYLGYSPDHRYFAFEEYGVQDGSGFPFANIFVVDLPADKWVTGSPIRVLIESEEADVEDARDQAAEQAAAKLDELEIGEAAHVIAVNGDGEVNADEGHELTFGAPGYGLSEPQDPRTLSVKTFPADSPENCVGYIGEQALGFALLLDGEEIYRDNGALPQSRGCPLDYRVYAVVTAPEWSTAPGGTLAVIASYPFGFEGPDRRFLVVPMP